jgi:O-antigen ligase
VVSFLVTMLFYLLSVGGLKAKIKVYVAAFIAFLVVGSFSFIPDPTVSFYENAFTPEAQESRSIRERMILMELALREFRDHPVLGVGMGNSSGGIGYPHNVLLEVAAEFGLLGLSVFLLLCYFTVRQAVRSIKGNRDGNLLMRVALSLFIFSFVESMFSSNMGGNTLLFVSIGLVVAVAEMRKTEEPPATSGAGGLPS